MVAEANRTLAQARSAVASAKQNRNGFFLPSNVSSSRKGKGKGKVKAKSKDSSCFICGRSSLGIDISSKGPNASAVQADGLCMRWVRV